MLGKYDSGYPVFETIKVAYRARNLIVHGDDINQSKFLIAKNEVSLNNLVKITMEWLRKALFSKLTIDSISKKSK